MRNSNSLALLPLLSLVAMGTSCSRPPQYIAPAPAGAVECAVREAIDMGYLRVEGEPEEEVVRMSQWVEPPPGEAAVEPEPAPGTGERLQEEERPEKNQLLFRQEEDGRLHIQVVSFADGVPTAMPLPEADSHARRILAICTTP